MIINLIITMQLKQSRVPKLSCQLPREVGHNNFWSFLFVLFVFYIINKQNLSIKNENYGPLDKINSSDFNGHTSVVLNPLFHTAAYMMTSRLFVGGYMCVIETPTDATSLNISNFYVLPRIA